MMTTQSYQVKGMHCASCGSVISKKLRKLVGVDSVDVNFATEKATVSYDPHKIDLQTMNNEIGKLGYSLNGLSVQQRLGHDQHQGMDHSQHLGLNQTKVEKERELEILRSKVEFVLPITFLVFGLMIWDILAKSFSWLPNLPLPMPVFNLVSFLLAIVVLFWIGRPFLEGVVKFLLYRAANMDTLIGIGTLTAFLYSSLVFLFPPIREIFNLPEYTYFDVTIVVVGFVILGKYLEARSKLKTGEAIEKLLNLQAKTAIVERGGKQIEIPITDVVVGDILVVKPGAKVAVDGVILAGETSIDESMITGESLPQDKKIGDVVIGATINKQGSIKVKATKVGSDTFLAQIIKLVEQSQGSKAKIQNLADKISEIFVPVVLGIAILAFIIWLSVGSFILGFSTALSFALLSFVGILVIACPCALGLATPTAIIVGVGKGADNGILIKNAESLEKLHKVDTVVLDKTGTITEGKPKVTDVVVIDKKYTVKEILEYAASIEDNSQHPLAQAIVSDAKIRNIKFSQVTSFKEMEGMGVEGLINKRKIIVSKPTEKDKDLEEIKQLEEQGKTVIVLKVDKATVGVIAISDTLKVNAKEAIARLHQMGIKTVMLTGDNRRAGEYIASQVGIDSVIAEVLPADKSEIISNLQKEGKKVAMVGDGINDAPALTQSDVGIAMATGTDIAIESADITLLHGDIEKIYLAIRLSKMTMRTIKQNLFWAFIYNLVGIPVAAGVLYPVLGIFLNPIFAGFAMAMSSVSVVLNSLWLKRS